jgi:PAS domain S-box-containing protein
VGKVLVVDDSQAIRAQVSSILAQAGFETVEAADGLEALGVLEHLSDAAMIICDVNMPRMNGLEMVESFQKTGRKVPIVMLTTEGQPRLIERAKKAGALGWIVKPFKPEMLLAAVRKVTGPKGSATTVAGPSDRQWAPQPVSSDMVEKGFSQTSSDRLFTEKDSTAIAEAEIRRGPDGGLGAMRRSVSRTDTWLRAFRELIPDPRAEVVTMLDSWVNIMTQSLEYEVAGVFECDFENGKLVPWLGQVSAGTQQDMVPTKDGQPFLFASPVGRPASFFSREVELDRAMRSFLLETSSGKCDERTASLAPMLGKLGDLLGLKRFLWLVHFSHSGIRQAAILLVSGFATSVRSEEELEADESDFVSLGRHLGSLIDNAGLITELELERVGLRQVNEQVARAREQLVQIFRTLPGALFLSDRRGVVESLNAAATELCGCSEADLIGSSILELFDCPGELTIAALSARGSVFRAEANCSTKAGQNIPVLLSVALLPGTDDTGDLPAGVVCVVLDMRERKKLEMELRQAQKLESVGRLAAGIAHEINTPVQFVGDSIHFVHDAMNDLLPLIERYRALRLSVPEGTSSFPAAQDIAQAEVDADLDYVIKNVPESLDRAIDGLNRVATIVRAMKEFAHPDQKEMAAVDLNHCIQSTLVVARNEYKYVADMATDFGDLPLVTCLAGEINQAILNVVVNASHAIADVVKGTPRRGRIAVRTQLSGDTVVVSISDDGGGIPEAIRERIFDPFFTTKEVGRGTGQGLSIARSVVVEKHGGRFTFETEVGKGTTFFIHLPIDGRRSAEPVDTNENLIG